MSHLNGSMVHGSEMKIVFSKPVPIPPQPVYPPPAHVRHIRANTSAAAGKVLSGGEHSWGRGKTDEQVMHKVSHVAESDATGYSYSHSMVGVLIFCKVHGRVRSRFRPGSISLLHIKALRPVPL